MLPYHNTKTMERRCTGNGVCLLQYGNHDYYRSYDCSHQCKLISCPNCEICYTQNPKWVQDCHNGRCFNCDLTFGKNLEKSNILLECPVCLETKTLYLLDCNHQLCATCMQKIYFPGITKEHKLYEINEYTPSQYYGTDEADTDDNEESEEENFIQELLEELNEDNHEINIERYHYERKCPYAEKNILHLGIQKTSYRGR